MPRWTIFLLIGFLACAVAATAQTAPLPDEVLHKIGYVNPSGRPADFHAVMLWGIAIADTRVPGFESARVEISSVELSCRADGKDYQLIHDVGRIHGGLYRRIPWFQGNKPEPMAMMVDEAAHTVTLPVGQRPDRIWHFWSASPRPALPAGKLEGCTVKVRANLSPGALLQVGMDYWRDTTVLFGSGGNNHEAGASDWYFPSDQWQDAVFTDVPGRDP
ncbi:MAG TPA: hypothetical protein VF753_02815 [Terriglobales bacterium]